MRQWNVYYTPPYQRVPKNPKTKKPPVKPARMRLTRREIPPTQLRPAETVLATLPGNLTYTDAHKRARGLTAAMTQAA